VIVATSTLELGIDVGDLDRVIQIDAPGKVSSFLQRLGRTGRRPGAKRNCLFLAASDDGLLEACGLVALWRAGYLEPTCPPGLPVHVLAQQLLALTLQEGQLPKHEWAEWLVGMPGFAAIPAADREAVVDHLVAQSILANEGGVLSLGLSGEQMFGGRRYPELFSVFAGEPLFTVYLGRTEMGRVHESSFIISRGGDPVVLLAGRSWRVTHIDWGRSEAFVEAVKEVGRSRWRGEGRPLHFRMSRAVRDVLADRTPQIGWSRRARERVADLRQGFGWLGADEGTILLREGTRNTTWWTFAGQLANDALASYLERSGYAASSTGNLALTFRDERAGLSDAIEKMRRIAPEALLPPVRDEAVSRLKFSRCVPQDLARRSLETRLADTVAVKAVLAEPIREVGMVEP
jgi:ATP-dependent Lhr-like helicase